VYATARRPEAIDDLAAAGMRTLPLDVTDEASRTAAVARIEDERGAVDVLINSAGYGISTAVEDLSLDDARGLFETNVFGLVRLTQLVLGGMRDQGAGRIVNLSSVFGRYAGPGGGFYHATKHAVEALSDALRLETAGFGIRVIVIEPGPVRTTEFSTTYVQNSGTGNPAYADFHERTASYYDAIYRGTRRTLAGTFAIDSDDVAKVIERAVRSSRPRARYPVGFLARSTIAARRVAPDLVFDNLFVRRLFPVP
jgi:NADP-dependent 3-hydroxy acid dehydrogenase YdfG